MSSIILEIKEKKTVFNDIFNPVEFPKLFLNISYEDILGKIHEKRFLADMQFPFGIRCSGKEDEICEIATMQIELKEQRISD
jgi:hypothetical protein